MSKPLDQSTQYSNQSVYRYEVIFGKNFISTGGLESTREICKRLSVSPGTRVLDVGSGLGGSAFHLASDYGARVLGVDLLPSLVEDATARAEAQGFGDAVAFVQADIMEVPLPEASYDLVYSRDALLYIEDKLELYRRLRGFLAPGGRLFVSDYGRGPEPLSPEFKSYSGDAGYFLLEPEGYAEVLREAGFANARAEDRTADFIEIMRTEMDRVREVCAGPEPALTDEDREYLLDRWARKIDWCTEGHMRWVHLYGNA